MTYKTVSLNEKAYSLLRQAKEEKESFSDTIIRILSKPDILQFLKLAGALKDELSKAQQTIKDLSLKGNAYNTELIKVRKKLNSSEDENNKLEKENSRIKSDLDKALSDIQSLRTKLSSE